LTWKIDIAEEARKSLKKLDKSIEEHILSYLRKIEKSQNPKSVGKPLAGNMKGLWRYRTGDYRIICNIQNKELIVLVLEVGHRSKIYK
jgi:mRNA interferase RelE/StbE